MQFILYFNAQQGRQQRRPLPSLRYLSFFYGYRDTLLLDTLASLKTAGLGLLESWGHLNGLYRSEHGELEEAAGALELSENISSVINRTTSAVRGVAFLSSSVLNRIKNCPKVTKTKLVCNPYFGYFALFCPEMYSLQGQCGFTTIICRKT